MPVRLGLRWAVLAAAITIPAAAQQSDIKVDRLPRPAAHTPAAAKIADALAKQEAQIQKDVADCGALDTEHRGIEYHVGARRLLETGTIYSVEIAANWFCGGAYPDSDAYALNFDLRSGEPYDLGRAFHVRTGDGAEAAAPIVLKHMPKDSQNDCGLDVSTVAQTLQQADLSLGVTSEYLIFYFRGVPHVARACFPPAQVPLTELSSVADRQELQRLGPPFTSR